MAREITQAHIDTNIHPEYRALGLAHLRQVRMMLRENRYVIDCKRIIKEEQQVLARKRAALRAWSRNQGEYK